MDPVSNQISFDPFLKNLKKLPNFCLDHEDLHNHGPNNKITINGLVDIPK